MEHSGHIHVLADSWNMAQVEGRSRMGWQRPSSPCSALLLLKRSRRWEGGLLQAQGGRRSVTQSDQFLDTGPRLRQPRSISQPAPPQHAAIPIWGDCLSTWRSLTHYPPNSLLPGNSACSEGLPWVSCLRRLPQDGLQSLFHKMRKSGSKYSEVLAHSKTAWVCFMYTFVI